MPLPKGEDGMPPGVRTSDIPGNDPDNEALTVLLDGEGYPTDDIERFLMDFGFDSAVPGICTSCHKLAGLVEPDLRDGVCEACGKSCVKSGTILAGVI